MLVFALSEGRNLTPTGTWTETNGWLHWKKKTQQSISISTSLVVSRWLRHLRSCDGNRTAFSRLNFEVILREDSPYKIASQDKYLRLLQRCEQFNLFKLAISSSDKTRLGNTTWTCLVSILVEILDFLCLWFVADSGVVFGVWASRVNTRNLLVK